MSTPTLRRFDGRSIEEALMAAVAEVGDDLEVVDAQRSRRGGILGLFAKEHFEVVVTAEGREKRFDDVLTRMIERVDVAEAMEAGTASGTARREPPAADANDAWLDDLLGLPREPGDAHADDNATDDWVEADLVLPAGPSGTIRLVPDADGNVELVLGGEDPEEAPAPGPRAPARLDGEGEPGSAWSRARLGAIGVPSEVLALMAVDPEADELTNLAALTRAIEAAMGTVTDSGTGCTVTASAPDAVVRLLPALVRGLGVERVILAGRSVELTPLELALAVRAVLQEGS